MAGCDAVTCPVCGCPRLLDVYAGTGGAAMGYRRAGFCVTGVDLHRHPYPAGELHRGGALPVLRHLARHGQVFGRRYAAVHASPPCQFHTALTKGNRRRARRIGGSHVDLIPATRRLLDATGLPYVIENVQGAPLRRDLTLCGEMFGLDVIRHRYFELGGWTMTQPLHRPHRGRVAGWRHGHRYDGPYVAVYGDGGGKGSTLDWQRALGIDWTADRRALAEAIPPAFTELAGAGLLAHLQQQAAA